MKYALVVSAALLAWTGTASADGMALATANKCTACHKEDQNYVGPSFKKIAEKFKKEKGAEAMLVDKVKNGSQGVWGGPPMPANKDVKDADAKALVKWILSL